MKTTLIQRFLMTFGLAAIAVPGLASGPLPYGHDDATYSSGDAPAVIGSDTWSPGSETWGPGSAHDDVTYQTGPMQFVVPETRVVTGPLPYGHDDVTYPGDGAPVGADTATRRVAARTPSSTGSVVREQQLSPPDAAEGMGAGTGSRSDQKRSAAEQTTPHSMRCVCR